MKDTDVIIAKLPPNHKEVEEKAEFLIHKTRIHMLRTHPFYATLATYLHPIPNWCLPYATLATDGVNIYYDPSYVTSIPFNVLITAIIHEVSHIVYEHASRRKSRDHETWNLAGDAVINLALQKCGHKLGSGWFVDAKYDGMCAEEVYADLQKNPRKASAFDGIMDTENMTPEERKHFEETWKRRIIASAQAAKSRGNLPGGVEELLDKLVEPKVDWRSILRNFLTSSLKTDYRWTPPNRRYAGHGIILPSMRTEGSTVAFILDTSRSMGSPEMTALISEIQGMFEQTPGLRILFIQCDADVQNAELLENAEAFSNGVKVKGRGGSDMRPAFTEVARWLDDGTDVQAVICGTDLCVAFPEEAPDLPVIWCKTPGAAVKPPFGDVIDIEL